MTEKAKFYWAIIGDSAPEPVAVTGKSGERVAYTIGCPDPFRVDGPDTNIELIHSYEQRGGRYEKFDTEPVAPMAIPETPKARAKARAASEKRLAAERKRGIVHGYAGFGLRARQRRNSDGRQS